MPTFWRAAVLEQEIREELGTAANQYIGTIKAKDRVHEMVNTSV